ncbi:WD40-repeat-containing domain protein [Catenaria anguillulae PL171]|uniref:WD40-repeat-containing domain protein n=1 Tax=Catenaria anguillulae PL171 TaxID=765915 RepID=A0A1Y2HY76_9FUNG|nr:WD40-repeat-containing domain protein [Catenaria anguillulae PL171]
MDRTISLTRKPAPAQTTVTDRRPKSIFEIEASRQTYEELLASCTNSNLLTFRSSLGISGGTSFSQLTKGSVINLTAPACAPIHRDPLLPCKLPTHVNPSPQLPVGLGCTCAVFSPYGRYLAVAFQEVSTSSNASAAGRHAIRLYPLDTEAKSGSKLDLSKSEVDQVVELVGHNEPVRDMVWSPDSTELYAISSDGTIMSWNFVHESPIRAVASHSSPFTSLALRPLGDDSSEEGEYSQTRTLLIGCSDGQLRRYQVSGNPLHRTIRSIERVTLHRAPILAITWDPEGRRIVTGDSSGTAAAWTFTASNAGKAGGTPITPMTRSPASAVAQTNRMFSSFSIASDSSGQGGGLTASGSISKSPSTFAPNAESIGQPRLDCIKIIPNVMV